MNLRLLPLLAPTFALLAGTRPAHAADAGVIGPTYEIAEPHFLRFIEYSARQGEWRVAAPGTGGARPWRRFRAANPSP